MSETIDPRHINQDSRLGQRMNDILQAQALQSLAREDQAKADAKAAAEAAAAAFLSQVMRDAVEQFKTLVPVYAERAAAVADLAEPLRRFWAAEQEIRTVETAVASTVFTPFARAGLPHVSTVAGLRRRAGLTTDHSLIGIAVDPNDAMSILVASVAKVLAMGLVFPGGAAVEGHSIGFNFDQGA